MGTNSRGAAPTPDLALERDILSASGLFDVDWYRQSAGEDAQSDPIGHYLNSGWRESLEPSASFPGAFSLPYFAAAGFDEPPAITWLTLKSAGWPMYETRESVEAAAAAVRATGLFDERSYAERAGIAATNLDPATHYVLVGERLRIAPSTAFDPAYYADRYPDVGAAANNLLLHYVDRGRAEGRRPLPAPPPPCTGGSSRFDPRKENVLLVINDASRTGAPILGWNIGARLAKKYNLFTVLIGDGELRGDFAKISVEAHGPYAAPGWDNVTPVDFEHSLGGFLDGRRFRYAVVNSSECCALIEPCIRRLIPTLFLVHEFAAYRGVFALSTLLGQALDLSTEVVFSASIVARSAVKHYANLSNRRVQILTQGECLLPAGQVALTGVQRDALQRLRCQREIDGTFVVLGVGSVHFMKGVDLFLAVAAAVQRARGRRPVHFVWVGHGFRPEVDREYSTFLQEQLDRSGLVGHVTFLDEVADLEPVYRLADAFFLASRLDPLPNVSIDAAVRGIPVVCFKDASGTADLLQGNPETAACVVEHLDTGAAARVILELADDEPRRAQVSTATRLFAQTTFDMESYIASLDALGSAAAVRVAQQRVDAQTLLSDSAFDQDMFLGKTMVVESRQQTVERYLAAASARNTEPMGQGWLHGWVARRPSPGFNQNVYVAANAATLTGCINPLADFIRRSRPCGPWQAPVLRPDDPICADLRPPGKLRVAIQAHFFYPELAADFLGRLQLNSTRCDLLVSTNDAAKAKHLTRILSAHAGEVKVRVVPNQGRDISPFLTAFADDLLGYDVVGHVHGKRTLWHADREIGEVWREFLWQNLIGGRYAMMDRIIAQFEQEAELGLVFPSDPHIIGWTENHALAIALAKRMGYEGALPDAFDFPVGTMFWMRVDTLRPPLALRLGWDDYPPEPLPIDGTVLHALERLLPITARLAGFTYSVTHVPGVVR